MGDNMVLTDGTRSVELYQITGNPHHDGIIMAYLRKEKFSSKPIAICSPVRRERSPQSSRSAIGQPRRPTFGA